MCFCDGNTYEVVYKRNRLSPNNPANNNANNPANNNANNPANNPANNNANNPANNNANNNINKTEVVAEWSLLSIKTIEKIKNSNENNLSNF